MSRTLSRWRRGKVLAGVSFLDVACLTFAAEGECRDITSSSEASIGKARIIKGTELARDRFQNH
jgi:hypothetical protein